MLRCLSWVQRASVVRECPLLAHKGRKARLVLHAFRILGFLFVGFGLLGQILDTAGYGGTGWGIEVDRWHPVLGNVGQGYEEGPTRLGEYSTLGPRDSGC